MTEEYHYKEITIRSDIVKYRLIYNCLSKVSYNIGFIIPIEIYSIILDYYYRCCVYDGLKCNKLNCYDNFNNYNRIESVRHCLLCHTTYPYCMMLFNGTFKKSVCPLNDEHPLNINLLTFFMDL